jgi:hypothetical protein
VVIPPCDNRQFTNVGPWRPTFCRSCGVSETALATQDASVQRRKALDNTPAPSHHENNYSDAVRALNAVERRLDAMMRDKDLPA